MAQLADVVNKLQPADSWRAPVTAADVASVSIEEMTARMKVLSSRKTKGKHGETQTELNSPVVLGSRLQGFWSGGRQCQGDSMVQRRCCLVQHGLGATLQEGVQEVGVLLLHGGGNPASLAGQRLTALMSAYSQVGINH
jgi:hypothetical protein